MLKIVFADKWNNFSSYWKTYFFFSKSYPKTLSSTNWSNQMKKKERKNATPIIVRRYCYCTYNNSCKNPELQFFQAVSYNVCRTLSRFHCVFGNNKGSLGHETYGQRCRNHLNGIKFKPSRVATVLPTRWLDPSSDFYFIGRNYGNLSQRSSRWKAAISLDDPHLMPPIVFVKKFKKAQIKCCDAPKIACAHKRSLQSPVAI